MMRYMSLLFLLIAAIAPTGAVHAYECSAATDREIAQCMKNASPMARRDLATRAVDDSDSRPSVAETPAWLDLHILEAQLYSPKLPEKKPEGEPWLQTLRNFPGRNTMLLRSPLGPPILIFSSTPTAGGKPKIFAVARWPADKFAGSRCITPGDTGQFNSDDRDYAPSAPAGVRLLKDGTALAIALTSRQDFGTSFMRIEETQFVQVTSNGLVPLLCIRNHAFQSLTARTEEGRMVTYVSGDDWTLIVTGHWHGGHADIRAVHVGEPRKTLLFRWNSSAGQYRQVDNG
jgi:hypothetical protein